MFRHWLNRYGAFRKNVWPRSINLIPGLNLRNELPGEVLSVVTLQNLISVLSAFVRI